MSDRAPLPAVPPADFSGREALAADIDRLLPLLGKTDTSLTLSALLRIIARGRALGADGFGALKAFAKRLRENRAFDDLYILTAEMRAGGMVDVDIKRWEVQALIELNVYETALDLARPMMAAGVKTPEGQDGYSALGRIYKQMYVDAAAAGRDEPEVLALYLERSLASYLHVWQNDRSEKSAYYGVNALAVARRAIADSYTPDNPATRTLADDVFSAVRHPTQIWSWATQGECLIAMGRHDEAARAYATFALSPEVSLFQLTASLRQLEEVWRISGADTKQGAPVRLLKAVILAKLSGQTLDPANIPQSAQVSISPKEIQLIGREFGSDDAARTDSKGLEQIFATNAPVAMQVIRNAMARARGICRIHANMGGRDTPFATGFAIEGRLLNEAWGEAPVIVTNNHVISSRPGAGSQRPYYCEAVFFSPDSDATHRVAFESILWESEPDAHDITILHPKDALPPYARPLSNLPSAPLPPAAVNDDGIGRVYVIGFPAAGELSFSFADNILLDHDAPKNCEIVAEGPSRTVKNVPPEPVRLHYRTPTLGGSSGSPVFDFNDFSLLGVHHRGLPDFKKLNNRSGRYAANEGIWIESIRAAIAESEAEAGAAEASYLGGPGAIRRWRSTARAPATAATPPAEPIVAQPIGVSSAASGPRFHPGAAGDMTAGYSPVATQILKRGKASAEEIAAASNESIIGLDDRTRIFETAMSPWRMICAIRCWWGTRLGVGTGALIAPNMLLTAAHVIFPRDRPTLPDRIEITPALNASQEPYGKAEVASCSVHPGWSTGFDISADVAAIHLAQPVGHQLGWFATAAREADELRGAWAHVSGYPGERPASEAGAEASPHASQLWHHSAPIVNVQNNRIFYATDTTPGQSGAPIYVLDPDRSPTPVIVGVHAYGKASTPVAVGNANSGAWIDAAMFDLIATWRAASARILEPGA